MGPAGRQLTRGRCNSGSRRGELSSVTVQAKPALRHTGKTRRDAPSGDAARRVSPQHAGTARRFELRSSGEGDSPMPSAHVAPVPVPPRRCLRRADGDGRAAAREPGVPEHEFHGVAAGQLRPWSCAPSTQIHAVCPSRPAASGPRDTPPRPCAGQHIRHRVPGDHVRGEPRRRGGLCRGWRATAHAPVHARTPGAWPAGQGVGCCRVSQRLPHCVVVSHAAGLASRSCLLADVSFFLSSSWTAGARGRAASRRHAARRTRARSYQARGEGKQWRTRNECVLTLIFVLAQA